MKKLSILLALVLMFTSIMCLAGCGEDADTATDANAKTLVATSVSFGDDFYAIGCRKEDSAVSDKINEALKTLIDNGKAAEISNKWFGKNIVILEDYNEVLNKTTPNAEAWNYIKDKGELIVGLDDTFAPMGFRDENNTLVGFDIDLANAVGEVLGVKVKFQPIDWNSKELELSSKNIDCIWNGMSATVDRQTNMSLTKKYLNNEIIVVAASDVTVNSKADLANLKIATQEGSAALETLEADADYKTFEENITTYPDYDAAILDLQAGRIDCIVIDKVLAEYKISKMSDK